MRGFISNYIGFGGRLNRQRWWISAIIVWVIGFAVFLLTLPPLFVADAALVATPGAPAAEAIDAMSRLRTTSGWVGLALFVVFLYPLAAISIKRRHDRNNAGYDFWGYCAVVAISQLINALGLGMTTMDVAGTTIPVPLPILFGFNLIVGAYGIYVFVVLGFLRGTAGPNNYGPDPLQG